MSETRPRINKLAVKNITPAIARKMKTKGAISTEKETKKQNPITSLLL